MATGDPQAGEEAWQVNQLVRLAGEGELSILGEKLNLCEVTLYVEDAQLPQVLAAQSP